MKRFSLLLFCLGCVTFLTASVVKYPYSMRPTEHSLRILWEVTDVDEPGTVYYGTDPKDLSLSATATTGKTIEGEGRVHYVDLTDLQPFTRYYYRVEGIDDTCSAKTAPEKGTAFRIFTISDIHENSCHNWEHMQDFICGLDCDLMMCNGDFVNDGSGRDWDHSLFTPGKPFLSQTVLMSAVGNHETGDPLTYRWSTFYDYFWQFDHGYSEDPITDPRGEGYYAYDYGNARIIAVCVNGPEPSAPDHRRNSKQLAWVQNEINNTTQDWILVFGHVGLTTSAYHGQWPPEDRDLWRKMFQKAVESGKKVIYFCGDDHSFEHAYRYGVHYVRPGCGRNSNYTQLTKLTDARFSVFFKSVSCYSTLDMAADGSTLHMTSRDSVGNVFYEYTFHRDVPDTINTPLRPVAPTLTGNIKDNHYLISWQNAVTNFTDHVAIVRNEEHFPLYVTDGTNVFEGTDHVFTDTQADISKLYYYGAFAYDGHGNITTPLKQSQWLSSDLDPYANLPYTSTPLLPSTKKHLRQGQIFISKDNQTFSPLGIEVCK